MLQNLFVNNTVVVPPINVIPADPFGHLCCLLPILGGYSNVSICFTPNI